MMHVTKELKDYIEQQILPIYEKMILVMVLNILNMLLKEV